MDYKTIPILGKDHFDSILDDTIVSGHSFSLLDTETTGMGPDDELFMISVTRYIANEDFTKVRKLATYTGYQLPKVPIPDDFMVEGITREFLATQSVDVMRVQSLLAGARVITHNARFDRRYTRKVLGSLDTNNVWICSLKDTPWEEYHVFAKSLLALATSIPVWISDSHHSADYDVEALLWILLQNFNGIIPLQYLVTTPMNKVRIYAKFSPFESKDELKARGYKWDAGEHRSWWKDFNPSDTLSEIEYLKNNVYNGSWKGLTVDLPMTERYLDA